jgi:predicted lipoprotein with Yx(FWY)xxD motif
MNLHDERTFRLFRLGTVLAGAALMLAACSNAGGPTAAPTTAATQPAATSMATQGAGASQGAAAYDIDVAQDATLGEYLTGEDGKSLYMFTPDTKTASSCPADCAATWPPFTLDAGETVKGGAGVTGTLATITRPDGSMQVTYAGHPLYYYSGDQAAGDTTGQGLFNKWYLLKADGTAVSAAPAKSGGRYGY